MLGSDGAGGEADGKCEGDAVSPVEKYGKLDYIQTLKQLKGTGTWLSNVAVITKSGQYSIFYFLYGSVF